MTVPLLLPLPVPLLLLALPLLVPLLVPVLVPPLLPPLFPPLLVPEFAEVMPPVPDGEELQLATDAQTTRRGLPATRTHAPLFKFMATLISCSCTRRTVFLVPPTL